MKTNRRGFIRKFSLGMAGAAVFPSTLRALGFVADSGFTYDVIVAGAGVSGVPAAIAAARKGAKVLLLEDDLFPGGEPVDMLAAAPVSGRNVGIYREITGLLNGNYSINGNADAGFGSAGYARFRWWHKSAYMSALFSLLARERNITLQCGSYVGDVLLATDGNRTRVTGVKVLRNGVWVNYTGRVVIDATGSGIVAAKAGAQSMFGIEARDTFGEPVGYDVARPAEIMPSSLWFVLHRTRQGVTVPAGQLGGKLFEDRYGLIGASGDTAYGARDAGIYLWQAKDVQVDTRSGKAVAEALMNGVQSLRAVLNDIQSRGFSVEHPSKLAIAECRRVKGEYILTANDLKNGIIAGDSVVINDYPMNADGMTLTGEDKTVKEYGIPYRCLIPAGFEGLLMAGKTIGGSHLACSSYRIHPVAAALGQAAGAAAALSALLKIPVRDVYNVNDYRCTLFEENLMPY
jgi:hypothetical protein